MVIRSENSQAGSILTLPAILLPDRHALRNQRFQGSHAEVLNVQSEFKRPFEPPTGDVFKHRLAELLLVWAPINAIENRPPKFPWLADRSVLLHSPARKTVLNQGTEHQPVGNGRIIGLHEQGPASNYR